MNLVKIDCQKLTLDKEAIHDYLKDVFNFSSDYGRNLDALYDCLTSINVTTEIEITNFGSINENNYGNLVIKVIKEVCNDNENLKLDFI